MRIGDTEITRDMLPSMQAWQANPDHLRQSIQDVLNAKLSGGIMMPQQADMGMMQTKEEGQQQWQ